MSIPITTVILAVLLLPGLILRKFYYTEEFSKQYNKKNFFELFFSTLIPSLILHSLWYFVIQKFGYNIDFELIGYLFSNKSDLAFTNINTHFNQIIIYNITIIGFAGIIGYFGKKIVRNFRIDRKIKFFRFINSWHYLFSGEFFDFPRAAFDIEDDVDEIEYFYIDVLTDTNAGTILYEGFLVDYELDNIGKLDFIVLKGTHRRLLNEKSKDKYEIPGHIITIPFTSIININLTFLKMEIECIDNNQLNIKLKMVE